MAVKRLSRQGGASGFIALVKLQPIKAIFAGNPLPQSKGRVVKRHNPALADPVVPAARKRPAAVRPAGQRSPLLQSKRRIVKHGPAQAESAVPGTVKRPAPIRPAVKRSPLPQSKGHIVKRHSPAQAESALPEIVKRPAAVRPAAQRKKKAGKKTKPLTRTLRKKRIKRRFWTWQPKPRKRRLRRRRTIRQRVRALRPASQRLRVVGGQAAWPAPAHMAAAPAPLVLPAAAPQPMPEHVPALAPAPDPIPPAPPVQPEGVPGDLYQSVFAFDIPTPQVHVDPAVWDTVRDSVPNQYLIPDAAFLNVLTGEEIVPLVDAPTLDEDTLAELAMEVTEPTVPEAASDWTDPQDPHGE